MKLSYHIEFDIASFIIHVILIVILGSMYSKTKNNRLYMFFLILSLISCVLDIVTAFTISYLEIIPVGINIALNTIYLFCSAWAAYRIYVYVFTCLNYRPKADSIISGLVLVLYSILLFVNIFTGIIFNFKGGTYNRGILFYLNFIVPVFYVLHLLFLLIFRPKLFTGKQKILHSTIVSFPIIAAILQMIFPSYLLSSFAYAMFSLITLFSLETPDFEELEYLRHNLENEVKEKTKSVEEKSLKIEKMSDEIVETLAKAIDARDEYTNGHSVRVAEYSVLLAKELGFEKEALEDLRRAALLHDVGKIGIPDQILQKASMLDKDEFQIIKSHTIKGGNILQNISSLPSGSLVARFHHERFDGKGYPDGLKGKEIPDFARIVSIADSFDAMNTRRVYRDALSIDEIVERLKDGRGTQFDPVYLDAFLNLLENGAVVTDTAMENQKKDKV